MWQTSYIPLGLNECHQVSFGYYRRCQQKETSVFGHETRHEGVENKVLEAKPSNVMLFVALT